MLGLILAFAATNVDGFSCLAAAFAVDPPRARMRAVAVATATFVLILVVSLAASLAIDRVTRNAAWFGLVPAAIGVVRLVRAIRGGPSAAEGDWLSSGPSISSIVLATGADNVAVYTPLFALRPFGAAAAVAAAFLALWALGCAAIAYVVPDLAQLRALRRYLEPVLAVLFIAIGVTIFTRG